MVRLTKSTARKSWCLAHSFGSGEHALSSQCQGWPHDKHSKGPGDSRKICLDAVDANTAVLGNLNGGCRPCRAHIWAE